MGSEAKLETWRDTSNPVDDWLGLSWDEVSPERVVARCVIGPSHHQPHGVTHGGVWCAIIESVASFGAGATQLERGDGVGALGVNNDTDFLRPHRTGAVTAVGTPLHVGRTQQLWDVVITRDEDGKAVARGKVRLHNVTRWPGEVGQSGRIDG